MRTRWVTSAVGFGLALTSASAAQVEELPPATPTEVSAAAPSDAPPATGVALDQLLTLPSDRTYTVEKKGGLTRGEWRTRYEEVQGDLAKERAALEETQGKLEEAGGGQWSVNPIPGAESDTSRSPIDFQLRTQLRRHREEIDRLEGKQRQLDIQANLAGVPEEWRR